MVILGISFRRMLIEVEKLKTLQGYAILHSLFMWYNTDVLKWYYILFQKNVKSDFTSVESFCMVIDMAM